MRERDHDLMGHGWRWIEHWHLSRDEEREQLRRAVATYERVLGSRPLGWNCRSWPSENSAELLADLPHWRTSPHFDAEQRLVAEYALAVVAGDVPEPLFAQIVAAYGEKGAIECTTVAGLWAFWAMLLNATRPGA